VLRTLHPRLQPVRQRLVTIHRHQHLAPLEEQQRRQLEVDRGTQTMIRDSRLRPKERGTSHTLRLLRRTQGSRMMASNRHPEPKRGGVVAKIR
jgi:hypothetical protein